MKNILETREKVCAFYASDYHFEMITLPYMYKSLDNKKEIVILTENNLKETVNFLLSKTNFKENKKEKILELDWENNDLKKFRKIKNNIENNKDTVIFIKGTMNYIKNANQNLEKWISNEKNVEIIDCYSVEELGNDVQNVVKKYNKILKTAGEEKI